MIQTKSSLIIVKLNALVERHPKVFQLDPGSPLYTDLAELQEKKDREELEFASHDDIWNELPQIQ